MACCSCSTPWAATSRRDLPLRELIAGMRKPSVSLVLGGGHSIGIPLAVSAKKSMIVPTASMMIHPVRMSGVVVGAPATYHYFQRIQEQITDLSRRIPASRASSSPDYMMATGQIATDVGTIVYGREAVESGLIDRLGGLHDALVPAPDDLPKTGEQGIAIQTVKNRSS